MSFEESSVTSDAMIELAVAFLFSLGGAKRRLALYIAESVSIVLLL